MKGGGVRGTARAVCFLYVQSFFGIFVKMSIVIHIYLCYIANIKHVFASSTQVIYYLIQGVLC